MKKKLVVSALLGVMLANSILPVYSGSLLTKSEDFSKAATYGMNMATYTAEKKDGKEALEKLMMFDVLFDVMGKNEEIFLNGDPAAFSNFKDDVLKVKLVIDKVAEVSSKLGAGEYDEALIGSVDGMVGIVNHPVVNALWEAVKLTYESHKLVKSSKAELQIEALYGVVNNDRRLIGTSSGDNPPTIPINSESITYFYNKYLITDASTRELVKAYVKKKLGENFPEISTSSSIWAYLTGTTEAVKSEYELQQLQDFENNSRRWIKALLEDLNDQVKKQWAETRLRQETDRFKTFSAKFGTDFRNMDEVFAYFAKVKSIEKQRDQFPVKLAELTKIKTQSESKYSSAKYHERMALRAALFDASKQSNVYAVYSMIINDPLETQFRNLEIECLKLISIIDKNMEANKDNLVDEVFSDFSVPDFYHYSSGEFEESTLKIFKPALNNYNLSIEEYIKPPIDEVKEALSGNDLDRAKKVFQEWQKEQNAIISRAEEDFKHKIAELESSKPDVKSTPQIQWLINNRQNIDEQALKAATEYRDKVWQKAREKTSETQNTIYTISSLQYNKDYQAISTMIEHFASEMNRVKNVVWKTREDFTNFCWKLHNTYGTGNTAQFNPDINIDANWKPAVAYDAEGANQYLNENSYSSIGKINDEGVAINTVKSFIAEKKHAILAPVRWHNEYISKLSNIDAELYRLDSLKKEWANFPVLDDDTINLYHDFAKYSSIKEQEHAEWEADVKVRLNGETRESSSNPNWGRIDGYRASINAMTKMMDSINTSKIKSDAKQYLSAVNTELINRQNDHDYLDELEKQWERWFQEQISNNIIIMDRQSGKYILGLGAGLRKAEGLNYAIISEPYAHYALEKELKENEAAKNAKESLRKLKVYNFIQLNMPNTKLLLDKLFSSQMFEPAPEENFLIGQYAVWKADLLKAEAIISGIDIKRDDSYIKGMVEVSRLLPYTVSFPELKDSNKNDYASKWYNKYGKFNDQLTTYDLENFELGKKFIKLREEVRELMAAKGRLAQQESYEETLRAEGAIRLAKYKQEFKEISNKLNILNEINAIQDLSQVYWDLRTRYSNDKYANNYAFTQELENFESAFTISMAKLENNESQNIQKIKDFYITFKQAYEAKSDYEILSLISNDWESSDETTISDLENHFRTMFKVFDSLTFEISNFQCSKASENTYNVSYDAVIKGINYKRDLRHEEKSSINEQIIIEKSGKIKLNKTLNGRFWYIN